MSANEFTAAFIATIFACVLIFIGGSVAGEKAAVQNCHKYYQDMPLKEIEPLCKKITGGVK